MQIRFFTPSAVDQKCWLLIVDFFTSKIYTYHTKKECSRKKNGALLSNSKDKRDNEQALRTQMDRVFNQNETKKVTSEM